MAQVETYQFRCPKCGEAQEADAKKMDAGEHVCKCGQRFGKPKWRES